jgi:hypothetical protein
MIVLGQRPVLPRPRWRPALLRPLLSAVGQAALAHLSSIMEAVSRCFTLDPCARTGAHPHLTSVPPRGCCTSQGRIQADRVTPQSGTGSSTPEVSCHQPERPLEAVFAAVCCRAPAMAPIITAKGDVASARVCIAAGGVYFEPGATCVRAPGDDDDDDQPYFQLTCTSP